MLMRSVILALSLGTLLGCAGSDGAGPSDAPAPASIAVTAGDGQAAKATQDFGQPLVVKVADARGNPIAGARISFQITSGSATLNPAEATSDAEGLGRTTVTAGPTPGAVAVTARVDRVATAATFSLTVAPLAVAIVVMSGNSQSIAPAQAFAQPLVVKVTDAAGNGVAGIRVTFETTGAVATLNPAEAATDAQGLARTSVTAGVTGGTLTINARAAFVSAPAVFVLSIQLPVVGVWRGTTAENLPIYLRINAQRQLDSLSLRLTFPTLTGTCTVNLSSPITNSSVSGSAFDFTYALNALTNLQLVGTFGASNTLTGSIRVRASPSGAYACGSQFFGESPGALLTTRTYSATR